MSNSELSLPEGMVPKMQPGFYQLQVLIQSTQGLCLTEGIDIDAMISIQAFGQIKYSKPKPKVGHQLKIWGQNFNIAKNFKATETQQLQKSMIIIKVWDHRKILKNALVGEYQVNIGRIYQNKQHVMEHQTVALSDINDNFGQISGLIKLSILIVGEKDKRIPLKMQSTANAQKNNQITLPPHIQRKSYQLTVDIFEGRDLKPVDGSSVDGYIGVEFGMIYSRTQTVANEINPQWNQKVQVPVHTPSKINNVILRLIDSNIFQSKEVLGSCYLSLRKLISQFDNPVDNLTDSLTRYDKKQWINFYGAQTKCKNNQTKYKYSIYPDHAPYFVGSVLVQAAVELRSNPTKEHTKHPKTKLQPNRPFVHYDVSVTFDMGMNLPPDSGKYALEARIGGDTNQRFITKMLKNNYGFVVWFQTIEFSVRFFQNQSVPDIFIYLVNQDDHRICFRRHQVDFNQGVPDQWRMLKPDLTMIKIHSQAAGYVKYRLNIRKSPGNKGKKMFKQDNSLLSMSFIGTQECYIVIDLYCAEGLLAGDDDGTTDPYFKFSFQDKSQLSTAKKSTLNPIYLQRVILEGTLGQGNYILPMFVTVFNKNPIRDQTIGICYIDLQKGLNENRFTKNVQRNPKPQWFDLVIQDTKLGKFLAGITVIQKNRFTPEKQLKFAPDQLQTYQISLFILGLRNLNSNGLMAIRKPFIQFDFDSLYAYGEKVVQKKEKGIEYVKQSSKQNEFTKNIKTEPKQSGTSINIKLPSKTQILLPTNTELWPTLSGTVKNHIVPNLLEPMIGYFSIDLKAAQKRTNQLKQRYLTRQKTMKFQQLNTHVQSANKLSKLDQNLVKKLRNFVVQNINYNWSQMNQFIGPKLNQVKLRETGDPRCKLDHNFIVVIPKYVWEEKKNRFVQKYKNLINEQYKKIGYDSTQTMKKTKKHQRNRHYRFCLGQPYQDYYRRVYGVELGVYDQIAIRKGRVLLPEQKNQIFTRVFSQQDVEVGFYKGNCLITEKVGGRKTTGQLQFQKTSQKMLAKYMHNVKTRMYLYILDAQGLQPKLLNSNPNPFIVIKMGNRQISFKDQAAKQIDNPSFNLLIKQDLSFPQNSQITIEVRDKDFTGLIDQLIGETVIHAENRVFSQFGKVQFNNPIETHNLKVQQSRVSQGSIRFWVDFVPFDQVDLYKEFDIESKANDQFQLRVIVWSCSQVKAQKNDVTDMVDLYVQCQFNGEIKQTDVHYRTDNGQGSFNWRMLFPFKYPVRDQYLYVKVYDKELILRNQGLAYGNFHIGKYIEQAYDNEATIKVYEGDEDMRQERGWPCTCQRDEDGNKRFDVYKLRLTDNKADKSGQGNNEEGAIVYLSTEILSKSQAKRRKAGEGRSDPNMNPNLPQPEGRLQWSWNPLKLLSQLFGKKFKAKICCLLVIALIIAAVVFIAPSFVGGKLARIGSTVP